MSIPEPKEGEPRREFINRFYKELPIKYWKTRKTILDTILWRYANRLAENKKHRGVGQW